VQILDSTFVDNMAGGEAICCASASYGGRGGAIYSWGSGSVTAARSTFTQNDHYTLGAGTVFASETARFSIASSTVSGNGNEFVVSMPIVAPEVDVVSSTLVDRYGFADSVWTVSGSILVSDAAVCIEPLVSLGHNLITDGSCGAGGTGDQEGSNPLLAPLADNGGPTLTHLIGASSPALDAVPIGTPGLCSGLDQRSVARPQGAGCDIGAVERMPSDP
jgi:hypothetical protein